MNLRRAGGTAAQAALQASSYRGMHTTQRRDSRRVKRWLKRASEPSRAKQGAQTPGRSYFSRGRQSSGAPRTPRASAGGRLGPVAVQTEGEIDHPLQLPRTVGDAVVMAPLLVAQPEALVGDVQRGEHRDLQ